MNISFYIPSSTIIIIWLVIGLWIRFKRKNYVNFSTDENDIIVYQAFCIIFAPINFFVVLYKEFINQEWKNEKDN